MMNCRQLYDMGGKELEWVASSLYEFFNEDEVLNLGEIFSVNDELKEKIIVKSIVSHSFDGRRIWSLKSLWFDNVPFGILQEAGREGYDHINRYISNTCVFKECINFINNLVGIKEEDISDVVDENEFNSDLTEFYGHRIEDFI